MIEEHKFGSFIIEGKQYLGDIKILDRKVKPWDERERHEVKLLDIRDLLDIAPDIIIIGTGNTGLLKVPSEIKDLIISKRITLIIDQNQEAINKYNQALVQKKKIAALFHATC